MEAGYTFTNAREPHYNHLDNYIAVRLRSVEYFNFSFLLLFSPYRIPCVSVHFRFPTPTITHTGCIYWDKQIATWWKSRLVITLGVGKGPTTRVVYGGHEQRGTRIKMISTHCWEKRKKVKADAIDQSRSDNPFSSHPTGRDFATSTTLSCYLYPKNDQLIYNDKLSRRTPLWSIMDLNACNSCRPFH